MKKYEFTDETKEVNGVVLHRIKAVRDFGSVKAGSLGGFIKKNSNLSHDGDAWVSDNAQVSGDARVSGDAWVFGYARVFGNAFIKKITDILTVVVIESRDDFTSFYKNKDGGISVACGCFSGNIDKFFEIVQEVHGDSKYGKIYKKCIELAKMQIIVDE